MIADLKLDEKQAADFRKVEAEFRDKMKAERKQADLDRRKMREKMMSLRDDRDAEMKKILTEDQYKQYLEKQRLQSPRKDMVARNEKMTPVSYCLERESFYGTRIYNVFTFRFLQRTLIPPPSWICRAMRPCPAPIFSSLMLTIS